MYWPEVNGTIIPFSISSGEQTGALILGLVASTGIILSILITISLFSQRLLNTPNYIFLLSVCLSGLILAASTAFLSLKHYAEGGWTSTSLICTIQSQIIFSTELITLFSLIGYNVDLYLMFIHRIYISTRSAWISVCLLWIMGFATGSWGWYLPYDQHYYLGSLQPSKLVCLLPWFDMIHPNNAMGSLVTLVVILVSIVGILYTYARIAYWYLWENWRKRVKRAKDMLPNTATRSVCSDSSQSTLISLENMRQLSAAEWKLLARSLAVSASYLFFLTPYLILIIKEMSSQQAVSSSFDRFATIFFSLFNISVFSWVCFLDARMRHCVTHLLYLDILVNSVKNVRERMIRFIGWKGVVGVRDNDRVQKEQGVDCEAESVSTLSQANVKLEIGLCMSRTVEAVSNSKTMETNVGGGNVKDDQLAMEPVQSREVTMGGLGSMQRRFDLSFQYGSGRNNANNMHDDGFLNIL